MVYIAIVAGILLAATSFAWTIMNSRTKAFAVQEVQQNGRFIMEKISQTARSASGIVMPEPGADGGRLELVMPNPAQNPTIIEWSGGQLTLQEGAAEPAVMHSSAIVVTGMMFANRSASGTPSRTIEMQLSLDHTNPGNRQEWQFSDTFSTTIELRNK